MLFALLFYKEKDPLFRGDPFYYFILATARIVAATAIVVATAAA